MVPPIKGAHLNGVLTTLSISTVVQAIRSAYSCVISRTHLEICFIGTQKLVPLLPLQVTIYYRKHLFLPFEPLIVRSIYFPYEVVPCEVVATHVLEEVSLH